MTTERVLVLGAESDLGRACAQALADSGATLALIAGTTEAEAAFAVKRLAARLGARTSQAIDASNEAAVRVMVRQVSKHLGGLDAVIDATGAGYPHVETLARRELERSGGGTFLVAHSAEDIVDAIEGSAS
ncbi:MAG TPA: SDR family oxidoreductase [Dehalococcoidia bacterium]|nr:SDR family oxidoreductase [Dehalococcoidia bacterium]